MDSNRQLNGIMFAKERRLVELEQAAAALNAQLSQLAEENKKLRKLDNELARELTLLETRSNMSEVEQMQSQRRQKELEMRAVRAKGGLAIAEEQHQQAQRMLNEKQQELIVLDDDNRQQQLFVKRLERENAVNGRVVGGCGKIVSELERHRKIVERDSREIRVLEDKLAGKDKFLKILEDRLIRESRQENNPNQGNQARRAEQTAKVMDSIDQLKQEKLKSFQRIVRSKNAILLKSKSQPRC